MIKKDTQVKGLIFNIQRCSLHDGPGIRTTVFLKGCPLRCLWCDNPESLNPFPEIMIDHSKCIRCYECVNGCPVRAITKSSNGIIISRNKCDICGECTEVCNGKALNICGSHSDLEDVIYQIERDIPFFRTSGGGITATGGEPLLQPKFLNKLFKAAHEKEIHTALETSGYAPWKVFEETLKETDLVLYDIKIIDPTLHREMTGVSNKLILRNLERITLEGTDLIVRIPIVPAYNISSGEDIREIGMYLAEFEGIDRIDLMPYHELGVNKYRMLNRQYNLQASPPKKVFLSELKGILEKLGFRVSIGGVM
ncbi:MAG: glycyl-radical enzyme activating protein [Candidatus Hodarchaeota archaeon]